MPTTAPTTAPPKPLRSVQYQADPTVAWTGGVRAIKGSDYEKRGMTGG
jgi:hypothetical protein